MRERESERNRQRGKVLRVFLLFYSILLCLWKPDAFMEAHIKRASRKGSVSELKHPPKRYPTYINRASNQCYHSSSPMPRNKWIQYVWFRRNVWPNVELIIFFLRFYHKYTFTPSNGAQHSTHTLKLCVCPYLCSKCLFIVEMFAIFFIFIAEIIKKICRCYQFRGICITDDDV